MTKQEQTHHQFYLRRPGPLYRKKRNGRYEEVATWDMGEPAEGVWVVHKTNGGRGHTWIGPLRNMENHMDIRAFLESKKNNCISALAESEIYIYNAAPNDVVSLIFDAAVKPVPEKWRDRKLQSRLHKLMDDISMPAEDRVSLEFLLAKYGY